MILTLENFIITCLFALYFMIPAYFSNVSGLAFGGTHPIDFGKNFIDNRRIIGDGATWEGLIAGTIIGTIVGIIQGFIGPFLIEFNITNIVPLVTTIDQGLLVGFLLGFGALLGDACGSFIKRRLNIDRGKPAPLLDQLDLVVGSLVLGSIVFSFNIPFIIIVCALTLVLHLFTNIFAYLLGIKDVWY
ncbi:CDP-2,3-bis-(O-geranylgeranyl)-sn-glycerol synthase [Methanobrevibacter sp. DSM 116169]|uniref:CDP-2,3-bis-(O-geranylgeranyl)-sn-glycerol synthase n=1 Tax=Methanobrevibacter sp. DSM 116169 TaxID=3242727 RepID=UPI0038FD19B5